MKPIIIITCGQEKACTRSRAELMYVSGYFKQCLSWAKKKTDLDKIFIISAKYGLLKLDEVIAPYDLKMGQKGCVFPEIVARQAHDLGILFESEILSTAGADYQKVLDQAFGKDKIKYPFDGLTIGYRGQAMKKDKRG